MNRRAFLLAPVAISAALRTRLIQAFERIDTIDTHEHIIPEAQRVKEPIDIFTLAGHYAINDVVTAGLPPRKQGEPPPVWKEFEPYWRAARFTGYGEALRIAIRDVYGVAEINATTLPKINAAIAAKNQPGFYREILKRRMRLRFAVNDEYWNAAPVPVDPEFFVLAKKFDQFITPITRAGVERLEKLAGASIGSIQDLKRALEKNFQQNLAIGMVTVKSTIAYQRDLKFEETSEADAQRDFEALMRDATPSPQDHRRLTERPYRRVAAHMFHHLCRLCDEHKVPFQIHTGLHAGNGNFPTNSKPTDLTNLFFGYPRVQFDLFHIGYPYHHETTVLAKLFPNVWIDFCWAHIVSPAAARAALEEMIDAVPYNKIFGFGGDYRYPELSYAHLVMARRNIAEVLGGRVEARQMNEDEALEIARGLLHDNPARLFQPRR
jgi:predicted TIM-barrel fold metal-dependent hydrolase